MTPTETKSLRTGITSGLLWGGCVVAATSGKPAGIGIASVVAVASVLFSTGWRLPADLFLGVGKKVWGGAKSSTGVLSASVPVKRVVPLLLLTALTARGCEGVHLPDVKWPDWSKVIHVVTPEPPAPVKATAATYVYEKGDSPVPSGVMSALNKLNREKIVATLLEADPKDGTGDVPEQYKAALAAAKEAGLPALVVAAGDKVIAVVKNPKDEQAVLDAAK